MSVPEKYGLFTKEFFHREQAKHPPGRNTFLKSSQLKSIQTRIYRKPKFLTKPEESNIIERFLFYLQPESQSGVVNIFIMEKQSIYREETLFTKTAN